MIGDKWRYFYMFYIQKMFYFQRGNVCSSCKQPFRISPGSPIVCPDTARPIALPFYQQKSVKTGKEENHVSLFFTVPHYRHVSGFLTCRQFPTSFSSSFLNILSAAFCCIHHVLENFKVKRWLKKW